ncbi:hypothetical protein HDU90_004301 [Geranomyces variabilis]|nr:hypothetical protein HDU90_004301 [Geranomyces variabilis]
MNTDLNATRSDYSNVLHDVGNEPTRPSQNANCGSVAKGNGPYPAASPSDFITQFTQLAAALKEGVKEGVKEGFASNAREMSAALKSGFDVITPALNANTKALTEGFASITPKLVAHTQALTTGFDGVVKGFETQNRKLDALGVATVRIAVTAEEWQAHAVRKTIREDLSTYEGFTARFIIDFLDVARETRYIEFSLGAFCSIKKDLGRALCVYAKSRAPAMEPTVKVAGDVIVKHLQDIRSTAGGLVANIDEMHPARAYNPTKGRNRDVLNCWQISAISPEVAFANRGSAPAYEASAMDIDGVASDNERNDPSYTEP